MNMQVKDKTTFKSQAVYNVTARIQENTILNRGLLDLGGLAGPQIIMSNNNDEKIERGVIQSLYFVSAFLAPYILLPFFNKTFLARNGVVNKLVNNERKIIEVSKKYLTQSAKFMEDGIMETAEKLELEAEKAGKKIKVQEDFKNILNRFSDKEDLKNRLLKTHEDVLFADFLATALMWCAIPWVGTEITKLRTKRHGFSATYNMMSEQQSKLNAQKHEKEKNKKLITSGLIGIIPAIIFPKLVTKGLKSKGGILNFVKKIPKSFDYTKGIYPSKFIFGAIWLLCDYPSAIISSRDKYEQKDRAIRHGSSLVVFFGGDFLLNNILGRLSDMFLKTQIMDRAKFKTKPNFFNKISLQPKDFTKLNDLKGIEPKIIQRTKNIGAGIYWLTLFANMGLLGFALPSVLNKILKDDIKNNPLDKIPH